MKSKGCEPLEDKEYVESLENLLIYMCESYMLVLDKLLELNTTEDNKAYLKVPTIQGSYNRTPIRELSNLEFQKPSHSFREVFFRINEKRNS